MGPCGGSGLFHPPTVNDWLATYRGGTRPKVGGGDMPTTESGAAAVSRSTARPVAEITSTGGVRVRLFEDWSWGFAPDSTKPAGLESVIMNSLRRIGRVGEGVVNLADTARAGAGVLPGGTVSRWWGDHEDDRDRALAACRRRGGPVPSGGRYVTGWRPCKVIGCGCSSTTARAVS